MGEIKLSENLEALKTFGTKFFKEELFKPISEKIEEVKYGKNHLQIARRLDGSIYTLDLTEACRILFVGATRAGKTFFLRSIGDRLVQTKKDLVYLNDCKNEFYSSAKEVQPKFESELLPGEKPTPTEVVTLRPTFFKTVSPELHHANFWYSVDMRALSKADFSTMMNITEMSATQQVSMEIVYQQLQKKFEEDEELEFSVDLINDIIEDIEELSTVQKTSLKFKFRPLESSHFFEKEHQRSVVDLIKLGFVPAINMENFDSFGKGAFLFPEVTLNIILREIVMARRREELEPLWIVMDEASRFIGRAKSGSLKESVMQSVDLDTRYGINWIFASQVVEDVPDNVFKQSKYIFIPATADVSTIKYILVNTGNTKNIQTSVRDAMALKRKMKAIKYSWIAINRMDSTMELIKPLPPLSSHLETSK